MIKKIARCVIRIPVASHHQIRRSKLGPSLNSTSRRRLDMKYKAVLMFAVVATIFAAVAQGQYTPSLMPPRAAAHPSAGTPSINVQSDSLAPATATCTYSFTVPGRLNSFLSYCVTVNGNIASLQSPKGFDYIAQGGSAKAMAFATFRRESRTTTGQTSIAERGARRFCFRTLSAL